MPAPPKAEPTPPIVAAPEPASEPAAETPKAPMLSAPSAPAARSVEAVRPAAVPIPPPRTGQGFLWPVKGTVLSEFGAKASGLHNDGINIAAARGTPVRAADAGVIAYAGNELRGFGNLILIKHANDWITAYAHNERLLVKRGDSVRRGQSIAHVGATGNVAAPQLHFEIRRGSQAVDPRRYLSDSGI